MLSKVCVLDGVVMKKIKKKQANKQTNITALHDSSIELSCDILATFSWTSQLKHTLLRAFLAGNPPKKLSKVGVLD